METQSILNHLEQILFQERLQDAGAKAISIHGRTRAQMYKGEANLGES